MNNVFGLDIGTRNVVGTVGHRTEDGAFIVEAQYVRQHETRSDRHVQSCVPWRVFEVQGHATGLPVPAGGGVIWLGIPSRPR